MEKIEATFWFKKPYIENSLKDATATVILIIDYRNNKYSIKPYCGTDDFEFISSSHKWRLWKAILGAINDAIDFANNELNINN